MGSVISGLSFKYKLFPFQFLLISVFVLVIKSASAGPLEVSQSCIECICKATSGCSNSTACYQDTQGEVYCGILLLQENHWLEAIHLHRLYVGSARLRSATGTLDHEHNAGPDHLQLSLRNVFSGHPLDVLTGSFDQCYRSRRCSELVLKTIAVTHLTDCDGDHVLTCKDVALLHQLGVSGCGALRAHALGRRARIGARRPLRLLQSTATAVSDNENRRIMFALEYLRVLSTHRCIAQPLYGSGNQTWQSMAEGLSRTESINQTTSSPPPPPPSPFVCSSTLYPLEASESSTASIATSTSPPSTLISMSNDNKTYFKPETETSQTSPVSSNSGTSTATSASSAVPEAPVHISAACFRCIRSASSNNTEPSCTHPLQKCGQYAITFRYYLDANGEQLIRNQFPELMVKSETNQSIEVNGSITSNQNEYQEEAILKAWLVWMRKQQELASTEPSSEPNSGLEDEKPNFNEKLSKLLPKLDSKEVIDTRENGFVEESEVDSSSQATSQDSREEQPILIRRNSRAFVETNKPLQRPRQHIVDLWSRQRQPRSASLSEKFTHDGQGNNEVLQLVRRQRRSKLLQAQDPSSNRLPATAAKQLLQATEQLNGRVSAMSRSSMSSSPLTNGAEQADALARAVIRSQAFGRYQRCVQNDRCAEQLVNEYVNQHLIDCNLDRVIDCDDFAGIHWFGRDCRQTTLLYSNFWKNFEYCSILADDVRREHGEGSLETADQPGRMSGETSFTNSSTPTDTNLATDNQTTSSSTNSLPPFVIRTTTFLPQLPGGLNNGSEGNLDNNGFLDKLPVDQYYANHIIELSVDCLQCICEASSDTFNCTEAANPSTPSSFYSSAYKISADTPPPPPPPQPILFFKLHRQRSVAQMNRTTSNRPRFRDRSHEPLYFRYTNNGAFDTSEEARIEYKALVHPTKPIKSPVTLVSRAIDPNLSEEGKTLVRRSLAPTVNSQDLLEICPNEKQGCGPFGLTKRYWIDAGAPMYRGAANDFDRCAYSAECAAGSVAKYISRNSADCTKDGRLSCADFGLIHKFKDKCSDLEVLNSDYYRKYDKCLNRLGLH